MIMTSLAQVTAEASHFPYLAVITLIGGFIAAVTFGSIAWFNSKRPTGWKDKERPDIVPEIKD